ncbi:helix-turn-helix domain-containing protein [Actinophytocola sp.]|uniref:helix-turn-helix domain-containing protein n=1 Tax=Actinophytocola sp. TaxID=1872138 RepID=UPI002D807A71|nr:helix-turn-helix domain-containing protein [Actinophytocola sp.]HET9142450.1 helix-turn-helix domain-containing protein [Actinophytocola sp.]
MLEVDVHANPAVREHPTDTARLPKRTTLGKAEPVTVKTRRASNRAKGNIQADVPRLAWTVREFAAAIGVNYQTALRMVHQGKVGHFKAGGEFRIPHKEIERLLAEASQQR